MNYRKVINLACMCLMSTSIALLSSCMGDGDDTIVVSNLGTPENPFGIPDDSMATPNPDITDADNTINLPGFASEVLVEDGWAYMSITLNGIWDNENGEWLSLKGTGNPDQNVWVSVDGDPKGIVVMNSSEEDENVHPTDIVFLVDNSGSMSEEANAIAREIIDWVSLLEMSGLHVNVGCVGYGDSTHAIDGGIDLTDVTTFKDYLDVYSGTSRTSYFGGTNSSTLKQIAEGGNYENGAYNECGMVAFHFANDNFSFRRNANRVYINFTDEDNQPNGVTRWSVEWLNPEAGNWNPAMGTIHTVYSSTSKYGEYPWLMSEYTGGTTMFTSSSFTGVNLSDLPVTGSLQHTAVIRFTNIENLMDGQPHLVTITIYSSDGHIAGEQKSWVIFGEKNSDY